MAHTCNPNNLQFYGLYLLIKGYLLLNCRLLEPQVGIVIRERVETTMWVCSPIPDEPPVRFQSLGFRRMSCTSSVFARFSFKQRACFFCFA